MLVGDAHLHSNPVKGLGAAKIAERFRASGGWFAALVALPPYHYDVPGYPSLAAYERMLKLVRRECDELRRRGLRVACLAGLHPAEVDRMESAGLTADRIVDIIEAVVKLYERALREGVIDGLGEFGRQHYRTLPHRFSLAEYAMVRALELARDADCIVHLHLESGGAATVRTVSRLVRLVNVRPDRVLLHHATAAMAREAAARGFAATVVGRRDAVLQAYKLAGPSFMVESDFIDDPRRPCVAQCPWELGSELGALVEAGAMSEEDAARIAVDNVARFYGVEPP